MLIYISVLINYPKPTRKFPMNKTNLVFSWFYFVSSILLWEKSSSLDPYYEACLPKDCGNGLRISFPLYIPDQQPSFCGYPGYEVHCSKQGDSMVIFPHNDYYIIDQISYENRFIRIYNAALSNSKNRSSCLPEIRNLTLLNEMNQFFVNPVSMLYLFSSCNKVLPQELSRYKVDCDGLVILAKDRYLGYAKKECKSMVVAPVELRANEGSVATYNYRGLLRRGFLSGWQSSTDCRECSRSGGRCGFDSSVYTFKCFSPDGSRVWSCDSSRKNKWVIKFVSGISASGIVVILFLVYLRRKHFPGEFRIFGKKSDDDENIEAFLKNYGSVEPKRYSYSDIKKITNSFKEKLGQGGYGCVYKGMLCDKSPVAVKVLHESKGNGEQFVNEVASISRTSHVNIVNLLGFCFEGSKRALIYEFVPNGSLEKFIYYENSLVGGEGRQLNWENLFEIAVGIARGLEYLHRGCSTRILHLDIKPHNILLDKDFRPKICDVGLAKLCPDTASMMISLLEARGTVGYIAPEVFFRNFGEVSHKSDVYSYGMMIMEMVRGRKTFDAAVDVSSTEFYFPHWIYDRIDYEEIGLRGVTNEMEYQRARKMIIVGLWCIQAYPSIRPSMSKVVEMLEGSIEYLQTPPKPFLSSPPRLEANTTETS